MATFEDRLLMFAQERELQRRRLEEEWRKIRGRVIETFKVIERVTRNEARITHANGDSTTLTYRDRTLVFKKDTANMCIRRISDAGEEPFEPSALTQEQIESEAEAFIHPLL